MADSEFGPVDVEIDLSGLRCPLPVLRTRKAMAGLRAGQVLKVIATDPSAVKDIPAFARMAGHELVHVETLATSSWFLLRR